ncbi:dTDP-4-dehydrorhamnose reductase [Candidatus Peregrinibacteria bacterium]|nr:dTDP-4-dehydrorhamnose reductase [Candidatus Peregrinibacteria bacterium]
MRVLIIGKNGILGHEMQKAFHDFDYIAIDKEDLDLTDQDAIFGYIMSIQPDIVINCAGYTDVDNAEDNENLALEINGHAVGLLAKACREINARLVHFSTDYVFKGDQKNGYNEEDSPSPVNAYGRSKLLGEELLMDEMEMLDELNPVEGKYFLIRTSWLFGENGKNFVDTILQNAKIKDELKIVGDQYGKPTFAKDLAEQVRWLISTNEYPSGIYHITNDGVVSWAEFAQKIVATAGLQTTIIPCSTEQYPTKARRPFYSILRNNMLPNLRNFEDALKEYISTKK